jgi:hypothetical protein
MGKDTPRLGWKSGSDPHGTVGQLSLRAISYATGWGGWDGRVGWLRAGLSYSTGGVVGYNEGHECSEAQGPG